MTRICAIGRRPSLSIGTGILLSTFLCAKRLQDCVLSFGQRVQGLFCFLPLSFPLRGSPMPEIHCGQDVLSVPLSVTGAGALLPRLLHWFLWEKERAEGRVLDTTCRRSPSGSRTLRLSPLTLSQAPFPSRNILDSSLCSLRVSSQQGFRRCSTSQSAGKGHLSRSEQVSGALVASCSV